MIRLFKVKEKQREAAANSDGKPPVKKQSAGELRLHKALYQFTQQSLPACKPVLTPAWVIATYFILGVMFIPVGLVTLRALHQMA